MPRLADPGGGGGGYAGIDPVAMLRLAGELRAGEAALRAEVGRVTEICRRLGISDPTAALRQAADWMDAKVPELERRVVLATSGPDLGLSPSGRWAWVDETLASAFASPEAARAAGAALADRLWDSAGSRDGVPTDVLDELTRYGEDPQFAVGLWTRLGPERAAMLLHAVEAGQREALAAGMLTDQGGPGAREAYLRHVDAVLAALSASLAAASRVRGEVRSGAGGVAAFVELDPEQRPVGPDFAAKLVAADDGWAAGQYLRAGGVFDARFLTRAATEIYDARMELASRGVYWDADRNRTIGLEQHAPWEAELGTREPGEADPMAGALLALSRNGEAARAWWDDARMKKILGADKGFPPFPELLDKGASLGEYLATAATDVRDRSTAGEESAEIAWRAVHYAAQGEIPEGARAGFATIFASYVDNVARVVANQGGGSWEHQLFTDFDTVVFADVDTPIGANFGLEDLRKVAPEVFRDERARAIVNAAMIDYATAAAHAGTREQSFSDIQVAEINVGHVFGFMTQTEIQGAKAAGMDEDAARKAVLGPVGAALDLAQVPAELIPGGAVGAAAVGYTRGQLQGELLQRFETHKAAAAQAEGEITQQEFAERLQRIFLVAENNAGMLDPAHNESKEDVSAQQWFADMRELEKKKLHGQVKYYTDAEKFFTEDGTIISLDEMNGTQKQAFINWASSSQVKQGKSGEALDHLKTSFVSGQGVAPQE